MYKDGEETVVKPALEFKKEKDNISLTNEVFLTKQIEQIRKKKKRQIFKKIRKKKRQQKKKKKSRDAKHL